MKYPRTPDASGFLIEPGEKDSSKDKSAECESEYPTREPCSKYRDMIQWEHESRETVCTHSGYTRHIIVYNPTEEVFLQERVPEHDIEKYYNECRLRNPPWLHTHTYRWPVNHVSEKDIRHAYHDHRDEPERHTVDDTCPAHLPCSSNSLLPDRAEDERYHEEWYNLLYHLDTIDRMIDILCDIEERTSNKWVDEDDYGFLHGGLFYMEWQVPQ